MSKRAIPQEKRKRGVYAIKFSVIRYCIICAPHKLPPKLRGGLGRRVLQQGEFVVPSTSNRLTCSTACSLKFTRQNRLKHTKKQKKSNADRKAKMKIQNQKKKEKSQKSMMERIQREAKKPQTIKKCVTCGLEFVRKNKTHKNCSHKCSVKYHAQFHQMSDVKAKMKKRRQNPKVKAKLKKYDTEYRNTPKIKAKLKQYHEKYDQKPEVKEKKKQHAKKIRAIKKRLHKPMGVKK